jgi:hypothetical protein
MLTDYKNLTTLILLDLLARETRKLTRLLTHKKFNTEYELSKEMILHIQKVFHSRNKLAHNKLG